MEKLILEAYCDDEYLEGPPFAFVELSPEFYEYIYECVRTMRTALATPGGQDVFSIHFYNDAIRWADEQSNQHKLKPGTLTNLPLDDIDNYPGATHNKLVIYSDYEMQFRAIEKHTQIEFCTEYCVLQGDQFITAKTEI